MRVEIALEHLSLPGAYFIVLPGWPAFETGLSLVHIRRCRGGLGQRLAADIMSFLALCSRCGERQCRTAKSPTMHKSTDG